MGEDQSPWLDQRNDDLASVTAYSAECRKCGVCCLAFCGRPFGIPVIEPEKIHSRLIQIGARRINGGNAYMRIVPMKQKGWRHLNRCVALLGKVRESVFCSVYESRPKACSSFAPGSPACLKAREWASMKPLIAQS